MNIRQTGGVAQQSQYARTQSIGGVALPNFSGNEHLTKSKPAMSEERYREAIVEQAKKDFAAGKFQYGSEEFKSLEKSFTSVVSPDRKGIITNGLKAIYKNAKPAPDPVNLLELLLGDGSVKYSKSGKDLTYAEFYDSEGNMVATYSQGQWQSFDTPAENARKVEMASIYNKAWGDEKRAANKPPAESPAAGSFDVIA